MHSLANLLTYCKRLKSGRIPLQHPLPGRGHQDTMDLVKDSISTLSAADSSPRYFRQLTLKE
uniref:Uncharacterized protein n=1 Tax=Romanomermis culicivorax TaxID=13658 RepID=A0A915I3U4_ROMCU